MGVDHDPGYVEAARRRHGTRGTFIHADVRELQASPGSFDLVSALGLLHHLDDRGADAVFRHAALALADEGRMVTFDGTYVSDQSRLARLMASIDRGSEVRDPQRYRQLAEPHFERVTLGVRTGLLRVPYTHAIMECSRPVRSAA